MDSTNWTQVKGKRGNTKLGRVAPGREVGVDMEVNENEHVTAQRYGCGGFIFMRERVTRDIWKTEHGQQNRAATRGEREVRVRQEERRERRPKGPTEQMGVL